MSVSDLAKEALVEYFGYQGIETKKSEWKRRTKTRVNEDYVNRIFEHPTIGQVLTVTYDDEAEDASEITVWEMGAIGFCLDGGYVSFTPMARWLRGDKDFPSLDDHMERGIEALPLEWCGDEAGDNYFAIEDDDEVRADLLANGYVDLGIK